jgi:hypothetical protein
MGGGGGEKCQKRTNNGLVLSLSPTFNLPSDSTFCLSLFLFFFFFFFFHSAYSFANHIIQQLFKLKREREKKKKK